MTTILVILLVALSICLVRIWDSLGKQIRRVDGRVDEFERYVDKSLDPRVELIEKRVQDIGREQVVNSEIISNFNKKVDVLGNVLRQDLQDQLGINKVINSRIYELRKEVEAMKQHVKVAKAPKSESKNSVTKSVKSAIPAKEVIESVVAAKSVVKSIKKKR